MTNRIRVGTWAEYERSATLALPLAKEALKMGDTVTFETTGDSIQALKGDPVQSPKAAPGVSFVDIEFGIMLHDAHPGERCRILAKPPERTQDFIWVVEEDEDALWRLR